MGRAVSAGSSWAAEPDSAHGPEFLHGQSQWDKYRAHLDRMETASFPSAGSRDFLRSTASDFWSPTAERPCAP